MGRRFQAGIVVGVLALAAAFGGCGGDDGDETTPEEPTAAGLAAGIEDVSVASTDDPIAIQWVDTVRLRDLAGLPDDAGEATTDQRWRYPVGVALGDPLSTQFLGRDIGFDAMAGERTVIVGRPPDSAALFAGVDVEGARSAFEQLGFEERDGFLADGEEGQILGGDPSLTGLNRVAIEGDDLAVGSFEAPVAAAAGREGTSLNSVEGVAAASDCLGSEVIVARVDDPGDTAAEEVELRAVGVEAPDAEDVAAEVICAVGAPDDSLGDVADCLEGSFNDGGVDPLTSRPFEDEFGPAEITEGVLDGTSWVRASFEPPIEDPVGRVFLAADDGTLAGPLGGDPASFLGAPGTPSQVEAIEESLPDGC